MADPHSLLNGEKFPVCREFRLWRIREQSRVLARLAAGCFSLLLNLEIKEFQLVGPDLFLRRARVRVGAPPIAASDIRCRRAFLGEMNGLTEWTS